MKNLFIILIVILASSFQPATAQYKLDKTVDGVQFYIKWGREVWYKKKSDLVLLIKVVNTNEEAVKFDLGIEFTENLQLVQESPVAEYCLGPKKKLLPRVNGIIFKADLLKDSGAGSEYELTGLTVIKVPTCDEDQ